MTFTFSKVQLLGFLGAIVLLIGVFLPIIQIPIVGSIALFVGLKSYGTLVFVLALISLALIFHNKGKMLLLVGITSFSVVLYNLYRANEYVSRIQEKAEGQSSDSLFGGLAVAMSQSVKLEFGWLFLIAGSICILLAAIAINKEQQVDDIEIEKTKISSSGIRGFLFFIFLILALIGICVLLYIKA